MADYVTLDSGSRQDYASGMRRDTQAGKPRYDLINRPFLKRWAELMGRGAEKYGERNWELAESQDELNRFKASALRHMMQWLDGDETEDHAAAVAFNVAAAEHVKAKLVQGEALDAGYEKLAQDLRDEANDRWPAIGGRVNPGFGEPARDGVYRDSGEDGYLAQWSVRNGEWGYVAGSDKDFEPVGNWSDVEDWTAIWPWTRIA